MEVGTTLALVGAFQRTRTFSRVPGRLGEKEMTRGGVPHGVAVEKTKAASLRLDRQGSQKGLQAAVRVCHPRGCLRGEPPQLQFQSGTPWKVRSFKAVPGRVSRTSNPKRWTLFPVGRRTRT